MLRALHRRSSVLNSLDWRKLCTSGFAIDDGVIGNVADRLDSTAGRKYDSSRMHRPRRFCVTTEREVHEPKKAVSAASTVLRQIAVRKLCAHLEEKSRTRLTMPVDEVLALTQEMVNVNEADSIDLLRALQTSGTILQHGQQVYLRPQEVAEIILQAIPDTEEEAEVRQPRRLSLSHVRVKYMTLWACANTWLLMRARSVL